MEATVLPVDESKIGRVTATPAQGDILDDVEVELDLRLADARNLRHAAEQLRTSDVPVAFPTETVYGLGADATRSAAVRGVYAAKQRPADNPLIVHLASLGQLRALLRPDTGHGPGVAANGTNDPIPTIYKPLIRSFWPGPLTIILPNPLNSSLAPEVTAGLSTFGARIPRHILALALIKLSGRPIAAPSANASTRPSPTAAEHVAYDLAGRIETIIDGGPCHVGVESTVVDGLSEPPLILRPGAISIEQLRTCPGWEKTQIGYKDTSEKESQPNAPGMKYRHYSPKATVVLFEHATNPPTMATLSNYVWKGRKLGIITTKHWVLETNQVPDIIRLQPLEQAHDSYQASPQSRPVEPGFAGMLQDLRTQNASPKLRQHRLNYEGSDITLFEINLGQDVAAIARGVFAALRNLDRQDVDAIFVEGVSDGEGDVAAAVMNRLRKAAELQLRD